MRMDTRPVCEVDRSIRLTTGSITSAINEHYAAFTDHRNVWIYDTSNPNKASVRIRHGDSRKSGCLVMAIAPVPCRLLALAKGCRTFIFDLPSGKRKTTLRGNGHNVTAMSFSHLDPHLVATGAADGSVCVWSLNNVFQPLYCLYGIGRACRTLSFNPSDEDLLAVGYSGKLFVWNVRCSNAASVPIMSSRNVDMLLSSTADAEKMIAVSKCGFLEIWDVQDLDNGCTSSSVRGVPDDDHPEVGILQQNGPSQFSCVASSQFGFSVLQVELIGRTGLVVLPENGLLVLFYQITADYTSIVEAWRLSTSHQVRGFSVQFRQTRALLVTYGRTDVQTYDVPGPICDQLGYDDHTPKSLNTTGSQERARTPTDGQIHEMVPEFISQPSEDGPFYGLNRREIFSQRYRLKLVSNRSLSRPSTAQSMSRTELFDLPPLEDSLDLPAFGSVVRDSLMPFLSPSIPASRGLPRRIAALDESLQLPPPVNASFNSATTATAHDSDSDDDALSGPLISSGTLLPGGVNVPLPRTCGALFAPSGHLIVFFPTKPRPASIVDEELLPDSKPSNGHELEVTKLFPTFGNLKFVVTAKEDNPSDSESIMSADSDIAGAQRLGLQTSSFDSRHKWNTMVQPTPAKVGSLLNETKVRVRTYDANCMSLLQKDLAKEYRLVCGDGETHIDLCQHNADRAMAAGVPHVADVWATLALSLQRGDSMSAGLKDMQITKSLAHTQGAGFPFEYSSGLFESDASFWSSIFQAQPSSLENAWTIRKLVNWAESQGDAQTLAYITITVLLSWEKTIEGNHSSTTACSQSKVLDANVDDASTRREEGRLEASTLLRANMAERGHLNGSLIGEPVSIASSRTPSQPVTPYLQSALSTPPLIFSTSSRRNTRLSASGSASPEHSRSSFSAAAKYYAQSITDKFASHGTSPPVKKTGTSPSLELSSSLPTTSGSWTKSVSFASADSAGGNPRRGLGIANDYGDSDSDKTIDENSHPHTPKSLDSGVPILWHQRDEAVDGQPRSSGMPEILKEIQARSRVWCGYYAERLRSWGMTFEATELEKVGGLATAAASSTGEFGPYVQPYPAADKRFTTCSICCCLIQAAQQGCPACGHTTHPRCLVDYLEGISSLDFTCPTGCGCDCLSAQEATYVDAAAAMIAHDLSDPGPGPRSRSSVKAIKKRASLTDPRRARARLEGESW